MADEDAHLRHNFRNYDQSRISKHNRKRFGPSYLIVDVPRFATLRGERNGDTAGAFNQLISEDNEFRAVAPLRIPRNISLSLIPDHFVGQPSRPTRAPGGRRPGAAYTAPYLRALAYLIVHNYEFLEPGKPKIKWYVIADALVNRGFRVTSEEALEGKYKAMASKTVKRPHFIGEVEFNAIKAVYKRIFTSLKSSTHVNPALVASAEFADAHEDGQTALLGGNLD